MAFVAGIDEAGLGPVLGPLVVSAVAFEVPDEIADVPLWDLLGSAVSRKFSRRGGKIVVADSKKVFVRSKANALASLERGVLAMLAMGSGPSDSLRRMLEAVAPDCCARLGGYPWYEGQDLPLPHAVGAEDLILASNALRDAMEQANVRCRVIRSEPVLVEQFNRHVHATNNKSTMLLDVVGRLLDHLWRSCPSGRLRIVVDRQGGRMRYLESLQKVFPACRFKILDETDRFSAYRISDQTRLAEVAFVTGGEENSFPVAMASMISKYLREMFMTLLNRFWARHVADLAPTAGYYVDGRRFFQQIAPAVERLGVDRSLLYRSR